MGSPLRSEGPWQCGSISGRVVLVSEPCPGRFEMNRGAGLGLAPPRLDSVSGGSREGVWSHGLPGHPLWSLRAPSPYLEVTGVGPEADPAHVLHEDVQAVPCPARYMQCCLPVPLQRSLVLLKPQNQCCWFMFGSHHPNTASRHIPSCCQPARARAALCSQRRQIWAQEPPCKGSVWLLAPWLFPRPWDGIAPLPAGPTALWSTLRGVLP